MAEELNPLPVPHGARERVIDILTRHFVADSITEVDLESRLERAYAARTSVELEAVVADLPDLPAVGEDSPAGGAVTSVTAWLSGRKQAITGTVPAELHVKARLGHVELDLTHATFGEDVTIVDVRAFMGYVQIRLPAGVRVESDGRAFLGYFAVRGRGGAGAGRADGVGPVVRVRGRATMGYAECFTVSRSLKESTDVASLPPAEKDDSS